MEKFVTFTYRIYPNKVQKSIIDTTFIACRVVYNRLLDSMFSINRTYHQYLEACDRAGIRVNRDKFNQINRQVSIPSIKDRFPFLKTVDSLALCSEWWNLKNAVQNYHAGRAKFPRYKSRKDKNAYATCYVNNNIRLEGKTIRLPKVGFVVINLHRKLPEGYKIQRVIVKEDKCGRYYAAIIVKYEEQELEKVMVQNKIGLDFKIGDVFIGSHGEIPIYPMPYRSHIDKLRKLERELGRKRKRSKNWWKCQQKIQKLHKRIAWIRKDFLHKTSTELTRQFDMIGVETLSMMEIVKNLKSGINVYDTSYCRFVAMLQYKLEKQGKYLIKIDKWYPSSKKCSQCGSIDKKLKLGDRIYFCQKCHMYLDRDLNAAINIEREAMRLFQEGLG